MFNLYYNHLIIIYLEVPLRLELRTSDYKTEILPLNYGTNFCSAYRIRTGDLHSDSVAF